MVSVGNSKSIAVGRNGVDDGRWLVIVAYVLLLGVLMNSESSMGDEIRN